MNLSPRETSYVSRSQRFERLQIMGDVWMQVYEGSEASEWPLFTDEPGQIRFGNFPSVINTLKTQKLKHTYDDFPKIRAFGMDPNQDLFIFVQRSVLL